MYGVEMVFIPSYRWCNWHTEGLSKLPRFTQIVAELGWVPEFSLVWAVCREWGWWATLTDSVWKQVISSQNHADKLNNGTKLKSMKFSENVFKSIQFYKYWVPNLFRHWSSHCGVGEQSKQKNPCSCSLYSCEGRMRIKDIESSELKGDGGVQL